MKDDSQDRCRDPTAFQKQLRREYDRLTSRQLELPMAEKGFMDKLFDTADGAMDALEGVLSPATSPEPRPSQKPEDFIDVESRDVSVHQSWEDSWKKELWWAMAGAPKSMGESFHVFEEGQLRSICGQTFQSHEIHDRQKLVHGKRIVACTSCIIAVSRRG